MDQPEDNAELNEVWQESDGTLLTVWEPGKYWFAFGQPYVRWDDPKITRPLRRLLDKDGNLAPEYDPTVLIKR